MGSLDLRDQLDCLGREGILEQEEILVAQGTEGSQGHRASLAQWGHRVSKGCRAPRADEENQGQWASQDHRANKVSR